MIYFTEETSPRTGTKTLTIIMHKNDLESMERRRFQQLIKVLGDLAALIDDHNKEQEEQRGRSA